MAVLRTPDERFTALPGFPYRPHYVEVVTGKTVPPLRMHYVDEGPADADPVVLLHGQPTWSFLYRDVIATLAAAGHRVVAPDHIGFGRSDKPSDPTSYTFARHVGWLTSLVEQLDLQRATLVVQDWGGPIGLSVLAGAPARFDRVVATNTILHTADPGLAGRLEWAVHGIDGGRVVLQEALVDYLLFYQRTPQIVPSMFVDALEGPLPEDVKAAYDAPFPEPAYTAGLRQLTALLPLTRNDPGAEIGRTAMRALRDWHKPFLTAYSDGDPATRGWETVFQQAVPGAVGQPHTVITGAGHFVPERRGVELARIVADFIAAT
jgi:haloalkane dehalogenase